MEDSASASHQNQRKRSSDNNAFAKFVPFSPPSGEDTESHEANPGDHHDHGHKRFKPNSEAPLSETNTGTNAILEFSSPSTTTKHSANSGPSPQSIGSKSSHIEYEENDGKVGKTISLSGFKDPIFSSFAISIDIISLFICVCICCVGQCHWKEDQSELESMVSLAAEELSKMPRTGGIYSAIMGHRECTVKRLKDLSNKEPAVDVGLELADAAYLLKLMSFSNNEIERAGQKGHKGAMLLLQAEILRKKGQELIAECQNLLRNTL